MNSIRWRFLLIMLLVVFLPTWWIHRETIRFFDRFASRTHELHMREMAFAIGELLRRMPQDLPGEWIRLDQTLREIVSRDETRLRVYDASGALRVDTAWPPGDIPDEPQRPDIVASALDGKYRASWELTPSRQYVWYHCAEPIQQEARILGVVLISRHTSPITRAMLQMSQTQRRAMAIALSATAVVAVVLTWTLTRRLRRLTHAASALAEGRSQTLTPLQGRDEIATLSQSFAAMTDALARRNRYTRDFVSTTSHELKAPITAIRGAAEILQDGGDRNPKTRQKFLDNILFESERMTRLIEELNLLTRVDAEASSAPREPTDVGPLLSDIIERARLAFPPPRATLCYTPPGKPLVANVHAGQIEQIIFILLDNAFRYTPPDREVRLALDSENSPAGERVRITLSDDGPGIAPSNLPKIFDTFFTTEPKGLHRDYGSGLGLAIAKTIVEGHGGTIHASSEPGAGAVFTISLPRYVA